MFNYFYTVEVDLESDIMMEECSGISSIFNNVSALEITSKNYLDEKECVNDVVREVEKLSDIIVDKYPIEKISIETYPNPNLLYGKASKEASNLSLEERIFWTDNKIVLFAMFKNQEDPNFIIRFVIYCIENETNLSNENNYKLFHAESPSKFLN